MKQTLQKQLHESFRDVTALGSFAFYGVILLLFSASPLLAPLLFGFFVTLAAVVLIRIVYFKNRPKKEEHANFWERLDASSFPSLHAARIVFLAILFSVYFSNQYSTALFTATAALVSYSRVYLQKHDWIDVAGGILVGGATYFFVAKIFF